MLLLGTEEMKSAELTLKGFFPESLKVYGCLFNMNRGKTYSWDVIADSWPDFRAIICKQKQQSGQDYQDREGCTNMCHIYSRDKDSLVNLLAGVLDWSQRTLLAGVDGKYLDAVKELAASNDTLAEAAEAMVVMMLEDVSHLTGPESDSAARLEPLAPAHASLILSKSPYCRDQAELSSLVNYISSYPSLSVRAEDGAPVSWLLLYHFGALGRLYTEPRHRRRGHARLLVSTMARALLGRGRPVYGFVEDGNEASLRLFTSLGFTHKPGYRSVWLHLCPK